MYFKKLLLLGALLIGGVVSSLAFTDTTEARDRYYRGYGYRPYYGARSYYRPYYRYNNYYGPSYGYRSYYRPYYGGYGYPYGGYGYPYGGYGAGVYVGRGGISIGF